MRCRKARSLLSAASSDEMSGRQLLALREHLSSCADCRREAAMYESIREAAREMPRPKVSDDFNTRLLNRIAQERFAETRTQAYLPRRAPRLTWRVLAPVTTVVMVGLVAAVSLLTLNDGAGTRTAAVAPAPLDDSYLTAQPTSNPNWTASAQPAAMESGWSLARQVVKAERFNQLTRRLTDRHGFASFYDYGSMVRSVTPDSQILPFQNVGFNSLQPGVRVYRTSTTTNTGGVNRTY